MEQATALGGRFPPRLLVPVQDVLGAMNQYDLSLSIYLEVRAGLADLGKLGLSIFTAQPQQDLVEAAEELAVCARALADHLAKESSAPRQVRELRRMANSIERNFEAGLTRWAQLRRELTRAFPSDRPTVSNRERNPEDAAHESVLGAPSKEVRSARSRVRGMQWKEAFNFLKKRVNAILLPGSKNAFEKRAGDALRSGVIDDPWIILRVDRTSESLDLFARILQEPGENWQTDFDEWRSKFAKQIALEQSRYHSRKSAATKPNETHRGTSKNL